MGIYRITNGAVGKALPLTAVGGAGVANIADVPVSSSAWLFENQSGTLGTNLNGSVIYVGGAGNVRAILSGVEGIQNKVTALNLDTTFTGANPFYAGFAAGSGYVTGVNLSTTAVTTVPNSPATVPAGLAVDIIVPVPTTNALTPGSGYGVGAFTDGNIGEFKIAKEYIPIFQTLLVTVYGAYFVGRTWEKAKSIKNK